MDEVASSELTPVLLIGEQGTGKSVAARYIHRRGHASTSPFVTLACASGPPGPTDSILFGRVRRTLSGGDKTEAGILASSEDGVLFLDGIDEASERLQKILLGVLETRTLRRVGSSEEVQFKARIVASASQLPLPASLDERLLQRLDVFPIILPPLRERGDDIIQLANLFIDHFNTRMGKSVKHLEGQTIEILKSNELPGNVRELRNVIERAMILVRGDTIFPEHFPERILAGLNLPERRGRKVKKKSEPPPGASDAPAIEDHGLGVEFIPGVDTIDSVEKRLIVRAMEMSNGVKSHAAKLLGISRFQLLRRLEKYGLEKK